MAIGIGYATLRHLAGVQVVAAATKAEPELRPGCIRNDRLGAWIVRPWPCMPTANEPVQPFSPRAATAKWLPAVGGLAGPATGALC
jgi:hypothetical protein